MAETRKIAAILAADVVGFSRMASADEDRTLARLRALRAEIVDPTIASQNGRVFKRTGDGALVEFRSVVEAVRCAITIQNAMIERNVGTAADQRIEFRIGIHLGDVVEESDGDLMGDGVNIAARLEGIAEPGAICLSEDAYRQVSGRLDMQVTDLGPTHLKNIARPIRAYSLQVGVPAQAKPATALAPGKPSPPRLSIVVLPFANISGDLEQDYFVDGVTESLTTDLSRLPGSFVIARNTAFTFRGKSVDVRQIGRELGVRYALEGSVQRSGARMRVSVQLIDAETGHHLWAERFDKPLADLFDMQDEIVARLANALSLPLVTAEARRSERAANPDALDLCFQARAWWNKGFEVDNIAKSRRLFECAVELNSADPHGFVGLAGVNTAVALNFFPPDRPFLLAAAEVAANRAISLAPDFAAAHLCLGVVQIHTQRASQGVREFERALQLDRNLANAHALIGNAKILLDQAEETEAHVQMALRLSPRDQNVHLWYMFVGMANFHLAKEEDAIAWLRRSIETNGRFPSSHFLLAATLARQGQLPEARSEARAGLAIAPSFTISRFRAYGWSDNPALIAARERYFDGLRRAGIEEG
jgi:TolB-like protein/class 3 adenylate cyclase